ncbi:MAG: oxidoreductase, partial [Candidatus Binatia bacterium]
LLHGAESADVAALGGRHAAHGVYAYLTTGQWPALPPIALQCEAPLRWVSPSAIEFPHRLPPRGRFILRIGELRPPADLRVTQGARDLWRQPSGRLIPNRPIHCAAHWLSTIDPNGGPITFQLAR